MAKEEKKLTESSDEAERPKDVGDEKKQIRNHESRPDNVVKKE